MKKLLLALALLVLLVACSSGLAESAYVIDAKTIAGAGGGGVGAGGIVVTDPIYAWGPEQGTTWEEAESSAVGMTKAKRYSSGIERVYGLEITQ